MKATVLCMEKVMSFPIPTRYLAVRFCFDASIRVRYGLWLGHGVL